MKTFSATCLAIALASREGHLRLIARHNARLGSDYVAIEDRHGLIEVALTMAEAEARVAAILARIGNR